MSDRILITAKRTSRCSCGCRVRPGDRMMWNPGTRRTEGCRPCGFTGEDPSGEWGGRGIEPDDFPIFHDY